MATGRVALVNVRLVGGQEPDTLKDLADELFETHYAWISIYEETYQHRSESLSDLGDALYYFCLAYDTEEPRSDCYTELLRESLLLRLYAYPLRTQSLHSPTRFLLKTRYIQLNIRDILMECASLNREDFALRPSGHPGCLKSTNNLATDLTRFLTHTGNMDLQALMISMRNRQILRLCPPVHDLRDTSLSNLSTAVYVRFERLGSFGKLAGAASVLHEARQLWSIDRRFIVPENHGDDLAFCSIYEGYGTSWSHVTSQYRQGLQLRPASHFYQAMSLCNRTDSVSVSFRESKNVETLAEAIRLLRQDASRQMSGSGAHHLELHNLAVTLESETEEDSDIEASHREALVLRSTGRGRWFWSFEGLAWVLCRSESCSWLKFSSCYRETLRVRLRRYPAQARLLSGISMCILDSSSVFSSHTKGMSCLSEAEPDSPSQVGGRLKPEIADLRQLEAAVDINTGGVYTESHAWADVRVLDLYAHVFGLLFLATNDRLNHSARLQSVMSCDDILKNASTKGMLPRPDTQAIEMVMKERVLSRTQTLHPRDRTFDRFFEDECQPLQRIICLLENGFLRVEVSRQPADQPDRVLEKQPPLNWGFDRLLVLPALDSPFASLQDGFVVIMNSSKLGHCPLFVQRDTVLAASLALQPFRLGFACARLQAQPSRYTAPVYEKKDRNATKTIHVSRDRARCFKDVPDILSNSIVQPIPEAPRLNSTQGRTTMRLWGCVTGELGALPTHAAGSYPDANPTCVTHYIVSLYTPTIASPNLARDMWRSMIGTIICELSSLTTALLEMSAIHSPDLGENAANSWEALVHLRLDRLDAISSGGSPTCLISNHCEQRSEILKNLADGLLAFCHSSHSMPNLDKAISIFEEDLRLRPEGHERRAEALTNLVDALYRFCCNRKVDETLGKRSIECLREALHLRPPGHPLRDQSSHKLAPSLRAVGYERLGGLDIHGKSVSLNHEILLLRPLDHLERSDSMDSLANDLLIMFSQTSHMKILAEIVSLRCEVLLTRPPGHPPRSDSLHNLGMALCISFEYLGDSRILAEAIRTLHQATKLRPMGHPQRYIVLDTLGRALSLRSSYEQRSESCLEPIALQREALRFLPVNYSMQAGMMCNLAKSLLVSVRCSGDENALAEAFSLLREVAIMNPQSLGSCASDTASEVLAEALEVRFDMTCDAGALSEAATFHRATLHHYPLGHVRRFWALQALARLLCKSRAHSWPEALACYKDVSQLCPMGYPGRAQVLSGMSKCFLDPSSPFFSLSEGISCLSEVYADTFSHVNERLKSATDDLYRLEVAYNASTEGAQTVSRRETDERVLTLYAQVIGLLPQAGNLGLDHGARLQAVAGFDQIARNAAARAVLSGSLAQAVAMLEQGRGIFWTQTIHLRTATFDGVPEDDCHELKCMLRPLKHGAPRLGQSFEERERELEKEAVQGLVSKIRGHPGFDRFLLPPTFDALFASLPDGYVVVVNASKLGWHALLLQRATGLATSLALQPVRTGFDFATLQAHLPRSSMSESSEPRAMRVDNGRGRCFEDDLASLWISVVKPILDSLNLHKTHGRARPRLWWCATGQLGFLPIHAAGRYRDKSPVCASDYVVSSYVPTLASLTKARHLWNPIARSDLAGILVCAASTGEGSTSYLSGAVDEVDAVGACFASAGAQVLNKPGAHTSVSELRSFLNDTSANILHLACHGVQHSDPLKSSFLLYDAEFTIEDIIQLNLPHACFAFLSACETAKGDRNASDQAVHLAASMLFCGFRSVVGTMWSMCDADGPSVARCFYESLFKREQVGLDDIAYALDDAVQALRHLNVPASRWSPFVHIGG